MPHLAEGVAITGEVLASNVCILAEDVSGNLQQHKEIDVSK
jgi:hypothetical protein